MTYAVIKVGGKQYKVQPGDVIEVEQLNAKPNEKYTFSDVLLYVADGSTKFGNPVVSGITVQSVVLEHTKGDKIRVSKFKAKAKYRRTTGHRQHLTKIKIEAVGSVSAKQSSPAPKVQQNNKTVPKTLSEPKIRASRSTKKITVK